MQNLVLAVQNTLNPRELGAGTSTVAFFRSLGGTVGVAVLGAILTAHIKSGMTAGITGLVASGQVSRTDPDLAALAGGAQPSIETINNPLIKSLVEDTFSSGVAQLFLVGVPIAAVAIVCVLLLKEVPLGRKSGIEQLAEELAVETSMTGDGASVEAARGAEAALGVDPATAAGR
jgi:hypothetical protein